MWLVIVSMICCGSVFGFARSWVAILSHPNDFSFGVSFV